MPEPQMQNVVGELTADETKELFGLLLVELTLEQTIEALLANFNQTDLDEIVAQIGSETIFDDTNDE